MKLELFVPAIAAVIVTVCLSDSDLPYTFIGPVTTECEFVALTIGSRLADAFNSYDEFYTGNRFQHEYFHASNIYSNGFMRLHHADLSRHHLVEPFRKNKTSHHDHSTTSRVSHKSHQHSNSSSLHALNDKWLYILGDETMTPVFRSLAFPLLSSAHGNPLS